MKAVPIKNTSKIPLIVKGGLRVSIYKVIERTKKGKKIIGKVVAYKKVSRMIPDVKIIPDYYVRIIDDSSPEICNSIPSR
jgi:hypothetical protein